ncbi:fatty acid desaturase family protein [Parvularcula dongshanensis]|uniref:Fatty acid desaturase n=1 Tax=Parvularcula dongshanensis TaxID=1173995 RepID=A0A840I753_9PROT|nr:fatty acid desaturase family protein [Parvularcula dongshanensis]MBB4659810.1 fatty acid desaturase [Parvularcula dongshanensis]
MTTRRRADPRAAFGADWDRLRRVSPWRGLWLVGHAWGVIGVCLAASVLFPNPLVWLGAVVVIGARQLGLAILMHEAAHGLLHPNKAVNDAVGHWLCAAPVGSALGVYRPYHLSHHKHTQTTGDPDLALSAPFPVARASLRRKIVRDLTGQTFLKQRLGLAAMKLKETRHAAAVGGSSYPVLPFLGTNAVLFALLLVTGAGWAFLVWLAAMATWFPLATRIRNIAEHACVETDVADPFTHARTTRANRLERALIAPYWVNFHAEHHLFMYVPCYRLPEAHRILRDRGFAEAMTIAPGYLSVLRTCTAPAS